VRIIDGVVPEYLAAARRRWMKIRPGSSNMRCARHTTRWRESQSHPDGYASTISAPVVCLGSSKTWSRGSHPDRAGLCGLAA
jgi:hypothetical protein